MFPFLPYYQFFSILPGKKSNKNNNKIIFFFLPGQPSPAYDFASVLLSQQQPYLLARVAHFGTGSVKESTSFMNVINMVLKI